MANTARAAVDAHMTAINELNYLTMFKWVDSVRPITLTATAAKPRSGFTVQTHRGALAVLVRRIFARFLLTPI